MKLISGGFTLVEISLVLGILAIIMAIASLSLSGNPAKSSLDSTSKILVAYIKQQQMAALSGDTEGRSSSDNYGIYISNNRYTLFHGSTFTAADNSNFDIQLNDFMINTTLPQNTILFAKSTGEIINFSASQYTITLTQTNTQETKTITINKYGAIESIE